MARPLPSSMLRKPSSGGTNKSTKSVTFLEPNPVSGSVDSHDSSIFSGLSAGSNRHPPGRKARSSSSTTSARDPPTTTDEAETSAIEMEYIGNVNALEKRTRITATEYNREKADPISEYSYHHVPGSTSAVDRYTHAPTPSSSSSSSSSTSNRRSSTESARSLESPDKEFLRDLPNIFDRDEDDQSEEEEDLLNDSFEDKNHHPSTAPAHDTSTMASSKFVEEVPMDEEGNAANESLDRSEDRIAAMLGAHEIQMNADLQAIDEEREMNLDGMAYPTQSGYNKSTKEIELSNELESLLRADGESRRSSLGSGDKDKDKKKMAVITKKQAKKMKEVLRQARKEVEILRDNNEQFMAEIEQTEEEHESEMKLFENRTKQKVSELKAMYQNEIDQIIQEKDAAIVEAGKQAVRFAESGRKQIATLKKEMEKLKQQTKGMVSATIKEAVRKKTEQIKKDKEEEYSREISNLHQSYEKKLEAQKAENEQSMKTAIARTIAATTERLHESHSKDLSEALSNLRKRLDNEKKSAIQDQEKEKQQSIDELKKQNTELKAEQEAVSSMVGLFESKLMEHHKVKILKYRMLKPSEKKEYLKYFTLKPRNGASETEKSCQQLFEDVGFLIDSIEQESAKDDTLEMQLRAENEAIRKERNDVYVKLRKSLDGHHRSEMDEMERTQKESKDKIKELEASLENIRRENAVLKEKHKGALEKYQAEVENLKTQKETLLKMETDRKELAVALATGKLELAYTLASASDTALQSNKEEALEFLQARYGSPNRRTSSSSINKKRESGISSLRSPAQSEISRKSLDYSIPSERMDSPIQEHGHNHIHAEPEIINVESEIINLVDRRDSRKESIESTFSETKTVNFKKKKRKSSERFVKVMTRPAAFRSKQRRRRSFKTDEEEKPKAEILSPRRESSEKMKKRGFPILKSFKSSRKPPKPQSRAEEVEMELDERDNSENESLRSSRRDSKGSTMSYEDRHQEGFPTVYPTYQDDESYQFLIHLFLQIHSQVRRLG